MLNYLTAPAAPTGMAMGSSLLMLVVMLGIFYFLMIRPENKRKKAEEQMRASIRTGDNITTIGGIVGTVVDVKESKVVIEVGADRVRLELNKWAVGSNETGSQRAAAEAKKAKEAKAKEKAAKKG